MNKKNVSKSADRIKDEKASAQAKQGPWKKGQQKLVQE